MPDSRKRPPNSDMDITDAELRAIHQKVDEKLERNGMPTDDQCRQEIEKLNANELTS